MILKIFFIGFILLFQLFLFEIQKKWILRPLWVVSITTAALTRTLIIYLFLIFVIIQTIFLRYLVFVHELILVVLLRKLILNLWRTDQHSQLIFTNFILLFWIIHFLIFFRFLFFLLLLRIFICPFFILIILISFRNFFFHKLKLLIFFQILLLLYF